MQEPQVPWIPSLGQEDPLKRERATHSSILAWEIPWIEELGGLQSTRLQSQTWLSTYTHSPGKKMDLWAPWWPAQGHPTGHAELGLLWLMVPSAIDKCHRMWNCEQLRECVKDLRTPVLSEFFQMIVHTLYFVCIYGLNCAPQKT